MSKQIDEKVVSMEFDNQQFEANVKQSMSTIEKLKQALKFDNASKGFDNLNAAAKGVNMSPLSSGIEQVSAKFSALQVIGITALANITNSAVDAGVKLAKSLSIDNVAAGWTKYGQKTTSVATLMAQGYTIDVVTDQLERLNWFTDETSYNFTDMVENIAKFTATGKGLEESVTAMEGIATWAALSGQNAQTASRAMYQLSQAMGAGIMRKEDYKSIQNASMDTDEFRQKCIDAAMELGTLRETAEGTYQSLVGKTEEFTKSQFADSLTEGAWFTSDVMMKVYTEYSDAVSKIYQVTEERGMLASEVIDEIYDKAESDTLSIDDAIKALGYDFDAFALKAFEAAQKARTWTDVIDSVKDAVSTGWMNTFEIIFGNAEEATKRFTDMANKLYDIFAAGAEGRNRLLNEIFTSKWDQLTDKIKAAGVEEEDFEKKLRETAKENGINVEKLIEDYGSLAKALRAGKLSKNIVFETLKKFTEIGKPVSETAEGITTSLETMQNVVNKVIKGDFGTGAARYKALTEAGQDAAAVQTLVNKVWERSGKTWKDTTITAEDLVEVIGDMTDAEKESLAATSKETKSLIELIEAADEGSLTLEELIDQLDKPSGGELLFGGINNILDSIVGLMDIIRTAWSNIFTENEGVTGAYKILEGFYNFSEKIVGLFEEESDSADKLTRTFQGLFAVIDMIASLVSGVFKLGFEVVKQVLRTFNLNILDGTANVGDFLVKVRDWIEANDFITRTITKVTDKLADGIAWLKGWLEVFKNKPKIVAFGEALEKLKDNIHKILSELYNIKNVDLKDIWNAITSSGKAILGFFKDIGANIVAGLSEGVKTKATSVFNTILEVGKNILQTLKDVLGIHSPSTEAEAIGEYTVEGYVNGIQNGASNIWDALRGFAGRILDFFKSLDFGKVLTAAFGGGMMVIMYRFVMALEKIAAPFAGLGSIFSATSTLITKSTKNINKVLKGASKVLKSIAFDIKAKALKDIAIAIAILVGSLFALTKIAESGNVLKALGILVALEILVAGLAFAMSKIEKNSVSIAEGAIKIQGVVPVLLALGTSLLLLAASMKIIGSIESENFGNAIHGFLIALAGMVGIIAIYGTIVKGKSAKYIGEFGKTMKKLSISLLLFGIVLKLLGSMTLDQAGTGVVVLLGFLTFLYGIGQLSVLCKKSLNSFANMIIKFSESLLLFLVAIKLIGRLTEDELNQGVSVITQFAVFAAALCMAMSLIENDIPKIGKALLSLTSSLLILAVATKILGNMTWPELGVAADAMAGLVIVVAILVMIVKKIEKDAPKMAGTLLAMAGAIGILAGITALLGILDTTAALQGVVLVAILSLLLGHLLEACGKAQECKGTIVALAVVIGVLSASMIVLSALAMFKFGAVLTAAGAIGAILLALGFALSQTKNVPKESTKTIIAFTVAIGILAAALIGLSFMPWEQLAIAAAALSAIMLAFALSMMIMGKSLQTIDISSIGKIALIATAMSILAVSMSSLANVPWETLLVAGVVLVGIIFAISAISSGMAAALPAVGAFALALLSVAATVIICATGFYIFGLALNVIAGALPLLGSGLIALGGGILEFILTVASAKSQVGDFAQVVLIVGSTMLTTLLKIALGFAAAAAGAVLLGAGAVVLGAGLVIAGAGMLVAAAGLALLAGAIYILCSAASSGMEMIVTTMASLGEASYKAGYYLVAGFGLGIIDGLKAIVEACSNLVSTVADTICGLLGIHSPSTVAQLWGLFTGQGFAKGLTDSQGEVETSGKGLFGKLKGLFTSDKSAETDSSSKGKAIASSFTEGLTSGFDTSKIAEMLGTQGSEAGSNFSTGLTEGLNLDSIQNMLGGDSIDFSQFRGMMSQNGDDSAEDFSTALNTGLTDGLDTSVSDVRAYNPKFKEAGKYLVQGFASGITENTYLAKAESAAMAKAAYNAAKAQLDINSPSKVFRKLAYAIPEGLAQGINRRTWMAEQSAEDMANTAIRGTSNALARISDAINSDVDTQPTIRPVIDLSDISSGAAAINSMLGMTPSVGVSANLRSINSMMNNRQNGTVSDIVSAIKDLGAAQSTGNTYNINGITYDDGSNVSNAIATLVRAAKVERRV